MSRHLLRVPFSFVSEVSSGTGAGAMRRPRNAAHMLTQTAL